MADPFMEIRAMALLEFGCPPLPVANGVRAETGEPVVIISHDLLAAFMAQAFKQQDCDLNRLRRAKQYRVESDYYTSLLSCDDTADAIYATMSTYTQAYLATYLLPPYCARDVVVLNSDHVSPVLLGEINRYCRAVSQDESTTQKSLEHVLRACRALHNKKYSPEESGPEDGSSRR
jgi:hypothetical protein